MFGKQVTKEDAGEVDFETLAQTGAGGATQPLDSLLPQIDKYRGNQYIDINKYFCNKISK